MVSLKEYTKKGLIEDLKHRGRKIASMLDDEDWFDFLEQAVRFLSEAMYNPRSYIFQPKEFVSYNGCGSFLDVTNLKIDAICNVYYSSRDQYNANFFFEELGILPFISQSSGFASTVAEITNFIILQSNLNMINRMMELCNDWELFPVDNNGRQMLQMRNPGVTRVDYLPQLDFADEKWLLFDHEYTLLKELSFAMSMEHNAIIQMSAVALGVGKEASSLVDYWKNKVADLKKDWQEHSIITYIQ